MFFSERWQIYNAVTKMGCSVFFHLVDEVLVMVVGECLRRANDLMQVGIHELVDHVHIIKRVSSGRLHDVLDSYDVFMVQVSKQPNFTEGASSVCRVLKGIPNLLYSDFLARFRVPCRTHDTISALADRFDRRVLGIDFKQAAPEHELVLPRRTRAFRRVHLNSK